MSFITDHLKGIIVDLEELKHKIDRCNHFIKNVAKSLEAYEKQIERKMEEKQHGQKSKGN